VRSGVQSSQCPFFFEALILHLHRLGSDRGDSANHFIFLFAAMDTSSYKDHTTSRGIKYHYFFSIAGEGKPTLLFLHGFPSTSYDWHKQVAYFQPRGYGLVVPDMLGYGGTDKPHDKKDYLYSLTSKDLTEILDAEGLEKVIAIGHDW
jgi:soluble epoxide hydrolase/lipid-phosphate phosphatase